MSEALGLSIGVANMVAARAGGPPVSRSSVLTLFENRPTEIGLPEENPNLNQSGLVLRGFVERVGDRAPLVAADGTKYLGEVLTVEAIEAMARTVGYGTPVTIAVPAHWSEAQVTALREEFFAQRDLTRDGVAPMLVSDATAAAIALRSTPGFPAHGVVALCDFGASGTSVTLLNAGSGFAPVGPSVRDTQFSGDAVDQLIFNHLRTSEATAADLAGTARIGAQTRLLGECRRAKEQLSTATQTTVAGAPNGDIVLARTEFERLIAEPLDQFLRTIEEALRRNGIPDANLSAVAAVGGGASIPLVTARLSERFRLPVHTAPQPAFSAAVGATVLGQQQASAGAPTAAGAVVETPTEKVGTAGTAMTQAAWAAQGADADGALAWSQDPDSSDEPVPYTGRDATGEYSRAATELDDASRAREGRLPWYKRTALVLSVAGAAVAVLVAAVLAINLVHSKSTPQNTPPNPSAPPQTSQTVTITGPDNSTTVTVVPPPPPPSSQPPASTTQPPTTTTTSAPASTTTTTAAPTTTSQATTTQAPTTTRERPLPQPFEPPFRR